MTANLSKVAQDLTRKLGLSIDSTFRGTERRGSLTLRVRRDGAPSSLKLSDTETILPSGTTVANGLLNEGLLLRHLGPGSWPEFQQGGKDPDLGVVYLLSSWIGYDSMLRAIRAMRQKRDVSGAKAAIRSAFTALGAVHNGGVLHGDIQPEHLLYDKVKQAACVIDLGTGSFVSNPTEPTYLGGMVHFDSPELAAEIIERGRGSRSVSGDIYATAASVVYALTDKFVPAYPRAPKDMEWRQLLATIADGKISSRTEEVASVTDHHVAEILGRCLSIAPADRFKTAVEVVQKL